MFSLAVLAVAGLAALAGEDSQQSGAGKPILCRNPYRILSPSRHNPANLRALSSAVTPCPEPRIFGDQFARTLERISHTVMSAGAARWVSVSVRGRCLRCLLYREPDARDLVGRATLCVAGVLVRCA